VCASKQVLVQDLRQRALGVLLSKPQGKLLQRSPRRQAVLGDKSDQGPHGAEEEHVLKRMSLAAD